VGTAECPTDNGLVDVNITIPDFQVVIAIRIGANPRFVVNGCPLAAKIRQGHQVSGLTLLTFGEIKLFHDVYLPTGIEFSTVYTEQRLLTRASSARLS